MQGFNYNPRIKSCVLHLTGPARCPKLCFKTKTLLWWGRRQAREQTILLGCLGEESKGWEDNEIGYPCLGQDLPSFKVAKSNKNLSRSQLLIKIST